MTLAAACGWSLVRSLAVALAAGPVCKRQCAWMRGMDGRLRQPMWLMLFLPFLCPELWTGYGWSGFGLRLANTEFWNLLPSGWFPVSPRWIINRDAAVDEFLLDLLLFFRAVPVGTLALYFAPPPPLSAAAVFCRDLTIAQRSNTASATQALPPARWRPGWLGFALRGRWHAAFPAVGLMFLVSFQEFELASLIGRPAWTVWLFDAQVGGLALSESMRLALLPVACQLIVLVPLLWSLATTRTSPSAEGALAQSLSRPIQTALGSLVFAGVALTCVVPALLVGRDTLGGLTRVFQNTSQFQTLLSEIAIGTGYALGAAVASALIAARLLNSARASRLALAATVVGALPGLFGSLVLSLALIQLLLFPMFRVLYKTPPALAAGLVLFLLPRAMLLRLIMWVSRQRSAAHLAVLLCESPAAKNRHAARELTWQMRWRSEFWSVTLLTYWSFLDLTIAYLLAPVTIVSAPVMLYNQMHFGKNAVLAALVFLTVLIPALVFVVASAARPLAVCAFEWLSYRTGLLTGNARTANRG